MQTSTPLLYPAWNHYTCKIDLDLDANHNGYFGEYGPGQCQVSIAGLEPGYEIEISSLDTVYEVTDSDGTSTVTLFDYHEGEDDTIYIFDNSDSIAFSFPATKNMFFAQ